MEGEVNLFPNLFDGDGVSYNGDILKYVAWWPNPNIIDENRGYYLIIVERDGMDLAFLLSPGDTSIPATVNAKGSFQRDELANWQHTFFQGGFALVINNGLDAPHYILDTDGNTDVNLIPDFQPLPGWESYNINQTVISDTFVAATNTREFAIGNPVDFNEYRIMVTVNDTTADITSTGQSSLGTGMVTYAEANNLATLTFTMDALPDMARVTIRIESLNPVFVRAGVIRAFGDFLVAGNLFEFTENAMNERTILRNLSLIHI